MTRLVGKPWLIHQEVLILQSSKVSVGRSEQLLEQWGALMELQSLWGCQDPVTQVEGTGVTPQGGAVYVNLRFSCIWFLLLQGAYGDPWEQVTWKRLNII